MSRPFNTQPTLAIVALKKASINNPLVDKSERSVDRLEGLRREILTGSYHVDPGQLADAMLRSQGVLDELADKSSDTHPLA